MEHSFHYLLLANQAMVHRQLLAKLKDTGLTLGQPKVLDYLQDHDGANQAEIARACQIEPASLTSVLNRMEEKALVERRTQKGDRRSFAVYLTGQGHSMALRVRQAFEELEEQAFAGVSEAEREPFLAVFRCVYGNLKEGER
ncbi:MarR family winged helix-turn-helix transcriptional regulator [Allofournierella sp. CML151]|uniref:MarR family winged helix-turn-helix transcriptional regulator n=1 Tax=Allofournierella sp. CML151 TaxID=2998082 RepID=UPI0022EA3DEC|nr:MarR family transcriptional regulator [Fournierella sp. CML151]